VQVLQWRASSKDGDFEAVVLEECKDLQRQDQGSKSFEDWSLEVEADLGTMQRCNREAQQLSLSLWQSQELELQDLAQDLVNAEDGLEDQLNQRWIVQRLLEDNKLEIQLW